MKRSPDKSARGAVSESEPSTGATAPGAGRLGAILLVILGGASAMLALYQWMELRVSQAGGSLICAVNATFNCAQVWNSPFASQIHKLTGLPVAAWGLIWGITAFGVGLTLIWRREAPVDDRTSEKLIAATLATRLVAVGGVLSVIPLAGVSISLGTFCLTCLATYALVLGYAFAALRLLPQPLKVDGASLGRALVPTALVLVPATLFLLVTASGGKSGAGLSDKGLPTTPQTTPAAAASTAPASSAPAATSPGPTSAPTSAPAATPPAPTSPPHGKAEPPANFDLGAFLASLPEPLKQGVSDSLSVYNESKPVDASKHKVRRRFGFDGAPVRIVEFTDIRCGHCKQLSDTMKELERITIPGSWSLELRQFPLDATCNPHVKMPDPTGVRCTAAKGLICLDLAPERREVEHKLFSEQNSLTRDRVIELLSSGSMKRAELEACIASPKTAATLADDLAYAMEGKLEGTPLVLVNDRKGTPVAGFLFSLIVTQADGAAPAFKQLPPPRKHDHDHDH